MAKPLTQDTRGRLLDIAEQMFAQQGINGPSIRSINAQANLSPGILHYHFGNKDTLLEAIVNRRLGYLTAQREQLLATVDTGDLTGEDIAAVLISPLFHLLTTVGPAFLQVLIQLQVSHHVINITIQQQLQPTDDQLLTLIGQLTPQLTVTELQTRLNLAHGTALQALAQADTEKPAMLITTLETLNCFIAAGLTAL